MKHAFELRHALTIALIAVAAAVVWPTGHEARAEPLADRDWKVTSLAGFTGTIPPAAGLRFHGDGKLSGSGGCNRLLGRYTLTGDKVTVASPGSSRMMCKDQLMAFEHAFMTTLARQDVVGKISGGEIVFSHKGQKLIVLK